MYILMVGTNCFFLSRTQRFDGVKTCRHFYPGGFQHQHASAFSKCVFATEALSGLGFTALLFWQTCRYRATGAFSTFNRNSPDLNARPKRCVLGAIQEYQVPGLGLGSASCLQGLESDSEGQSLLHHVWGWRMLLLGKIVLQLCIIRWRVGI